MCMIPTVPYVRCCCWFFGNVCSMLPLMLPANSFGVTILTAVAIPPPALALDNMMCPDSAPQLRWWRRVDFPITQKCYHHHLGIIPVWWARWTLKKWSLAWLSGWTNIKISGHTPSSSLKVQTGNRSIVTNLWDGSDGNAQFLVSWNVCG